MTRLTFYAGALTGAALIIVDRDMLGGVLQWWSLAIWVLVWAALEGGMWLIRRAIRNSRDARAFREIAAAREIA